MSTDTMSADVASEITWLGCCNSKFMMFPLVFQVGVYLLLMPLAKCNALSAVKNIAPCLCGVRTHHFLRALRASSSPQLRQMWYPAVARFGE